MVSLAVAWGRRLGDWQQRPGTAKLEAGVAEEDASLPRCLAAGVSEPGDLGERLASGRGGAPGLAALESPGNSQGSSGRSGVRAGGEAGGLMGAGWVAARRLKGSGEVVGGRGRRRPGGVGGLAERREVSRIALEAGNSPVCLPPPPPSEPVVRSLTARRRSPRVSRPFRGRRRSGLGAPGGGAHRCSLGGSGGLPGRGWWCDLSPRTTSL